ncbi:MAG: cytochrome c [Betaproteobacteria bacterium]
MPVFVTRLVLAVAILLAGSPTRADLQAGRQRAQMCATCHGPLGLATMPNTPNLAGQPELYLSEQLRAYRSGKRVNDMMTLIAKPLTDDEIASLAAWFSSLQVEIKERP